MKRLLACAAMLAATTLFAQNAPMAKKAPASPPQMTTGTIGGHTITIKYSSPRLKGREGKVYGKDGLIATAHGSQYPIWRGGANAATTLVTDANLKIGDVDVPAGTYTLFVDITDPDQWNLIINKKTGEWGLAYDASQDLGKTKMDMSKPASTVQELTYTIENDGHGKGKITLAWENQAASVPVQAQK
jgi:hypothetical protein